MRSPHHLPSWPGRLATLAAALATAGACGTVPGTGADAGGVPACSAVFCGAYRCDARLGSCRTECGGTQDCVEGFSCEAGFCVGAECTVQTAAERCGAYACVLGRCSRDCAQGPCAPGFYCRGDTNACVARCTAPFDAVCGGYACDVDAGECEPYCLAGELECAPGHACAADGACVRP